MIEIAVSKSLCIKGLDTKYTSHIKKTLTLSNPMFHKLRNMGKPVWGVPPEFKFFEDKTAGLVVPRGLRSRITAWLDKIGLEYTVTENLVEKKRTDIMQSVLTLRLYQEPIVEAAMAEKEGLIVMGTGTGKTIVALEMIYKLGLTATILVPNNVLLGQFKEEAKKFYGYDVGIINGDEKVIRDITVATYQSLGNNPFLLKRVVENTSVLFCDEAQGALSEQREEIIKQFSPARMYGLTATPMREDGKTEAIGFYFGKNIVEYHETQCVPEICTIRTGVEIPMETEYHLMVDEMVACDERNKLIAGLVMGEVMSGRKVLVLTKRIEHYQRIGRLLPIRDDFHYIDSSNPDRNALLYAFKTGLGAFSAIFGTVSLLSVGTDVPSLDTLVIACDMRGEVLTTQSAGRILRLFEGKQTPRIIDLRDDKHPIFNKQYWARHKVYKEKGWIQEKTKG